MPDEIYLDELPAYLAQLDDEYFAAATHLKEPFQQAANIVSGEMANCIIKSQSPAGESYPPLAASTVRGRKNKGRHQSESPQAGSVRPLIEDGALIQSLVEGPSHIEDIEDEYFTAGTDVEYAGFQNFGTNTIPERPFVGFTQEAEDRTTELVADHIVNKLKRS